MDNQLTGTQSQVEWAGPIRAHVAEEFDRVATAFRAVARGQSQELRVETETVLTILEQLRAEVMANPRAGYFIQEWAEPDGKVRRMIAADPRFIAIREARAARLANRSSAVTAENPAYKQSAG